MSIFGTSNSKFYYGADMASNYYTLPSTAIITEDYNNLEYDIHTSIFTYKKTKINKGRYHNFKVEIYNVNKTIYNSIKTIVESTNDVYFEPHTDSLEYGSAIYYKVIFTKFKPGYLNNFIFADYILLEFESVLNETNVHTSNNL